MTTYQTQAPWAPYARTLIRRLSAEPRSEIFVSAKEEVPSETPETETFDALDAVAGVQHQTGEKIDVLREEGDDRPKRRLPVADILVTLRLAATFGSENAFREGCLTRDATPSLS